MNSIPGCWRGIIVDDKDPEKRGRVKVRIPQLHSDAPAMPDDHCPWCEIMTFGGDGFGDLINWNVGDRVFVMFEGANPLFPVVIGGWFKTSSYPSDLQQDYNGARQRWRRVSRSGAFVEFDERDGSFRLTVKAGSTQIILDQTGGNILIQTSGGRVTVNSPDVSVIANNLTAATGTLNVTASGSASIQAQTIDMTAATTMTLNAAAFTVNAPIFSVNSEDIHFSSNPDAEWDN